MQYDLCIYLYIYIDIWVLAYCVCERKNTIADISSAKSLISQWDSLFAFYQKYFSWHLFTLIPTATMPYAVIQYPLSLWNK